MQVGVKHCLGIPGTAQYNDSGDIVYYVLHDKKHSNLPFKAIWCEYDANHNCTKTVNSDGDTNWYKYDPHNRIILHTNSAGYKVGCAYSPDGSQCYRLDSDGCEHWYNQAGIIIHSKDPDGPEEWFNVDGYEITKDEFDKINT